MTVVKALPFLLLACVAQAQDRSPAGQASWILQRITGVKWASDTPVLSQMTQMIQNGDIRGAAALATEQPQFLSVTVKEMASQMSTREETVAIPLNDFSAMMIGVVRDNIDARQLLYGNFTYQGSPELLAAAVGTAAAAAVPSSPINDMLLSTNHYAGLERANVHYPSVLVRVDGQMLATSGSTSVANPDPAGVLTSHSFLASHAVAGTNRRLVEYSFRQFMCLPIVGWADTSAPDVRIGRDIDRLPGGDPMKFQTTCKGCHSVMDGFRGAFAKYDYTLNVGNGNNQPGAALYVGIGGSGNFAPSIDSPRLVVYKMNRPNFIQYSGGYISTDDSFINNAMRGVNATIFGWRGLAPDTYTSTALNGVHQFGRLIANSQQFSRCMAKRVFDQVCKHELPTGQADATFAALGMDFETNSYSMKKLFQAVAAHPACRL